MSYKILSFISKASILVILLLVTIGIEQHNISSVVSTMPIRNIDVRTKEINYPIRNIVKKVIVDSEQLLCMAKAIFYEAEGESYLGKIAVARVIVNRVYHNFANTPCDVVYQKTKNRDKIICQFSWACSEEEPIDSKDRAFKHSEEIAYLVLSQNAWASLISRDILFFHSDDIDPNWPYRRVWQIGNHIFYKK